MKNLFYLLSILLVLAGCRQPQGGSQAAEEAALYKRLSAGRIHLPNGWSLTPAGQGVDLYDDLPLNLVVSPSGKYLAITNNGQSHQSLVLLDAASHLSLIHI